MTNGITNRLIPRCLPGLRHGESRTRHTGGACAGGAGGAGRRPTWPGEGWGKRPMQENAGGLILELGKMDWSFFFGGGIRPIFVIGIGMIGMVYETCTWRIFLHGF